ncbi:gastrula zinc finger protein XlCGF26.1-like [Battus philenor]|uniref:gastrula zinc finger protein XlCGF26.1-like n=1 Tax=Battus philenor TaxID=42288 RepID=UPI0035D03CCA
MDIKTEPKNESTKSYCIRCLNDNNNRNLQCYNLQSEPLKSIFQVHELYLCYLCKRMVENVEIFIQTVLSNQMLLDNFQKFSDEAEAIIKSQPLNNLCLASLDLIELSGNNNEEVEPIAVYKHGVYKDSVIKEELKCEYDACLEELENDYLDDGIDLQDDIKEENSQLNLTQYVTDPKDLYIELCKGNINGRKRKRKRHFIGSNKIETFYITNAECMEERNKKSMEKSFLDSAYKCMDCVKGFNFKPSYDKHLILHSKENGDYECDICRLRMDTEDKLLRHQKYHKVRFKCTECGLVRVNISTLKDHYHTQHSNTTDLYTCDLCPKTFSLQKLLTKHVSNTHKGRVTCAYCMRTYANKDALKTHLITRHPKEVAAVEVKKKYVCKECGKAFKAPSLLKIHSSKHSVVREYYCVECDKSFKNESGLKQHLKTTAPHVVPRDLPLTCQECDKKFAIRRSLERHMNRVHLNIKPFKCDQCDRAYGSSWSLKQHRKLTHEGFKRPLIFSCPMCDKIFDQKSILKSHIRTHTGERPFQCSKCPATFTQSGILGTHMRLVHLKQTRNGKPKTALK